MCSTSANMSSLVVAVCLVTLHPAVVRCASIIFPEDESDKPPSNISDKLKECLADEFKIEFKGECRPLLQQDPGACPEGQWIVLDLNSASLPTPLIRGKCTPQRCPSHQHFWVDQQRCVQKNESSTLCPAGTTVATDFFGDGFCDCIKNPVHIKDEKSGGCYPAFKRGPCSKDKVWVIGGCRADNCTATRNRFPNKTIVPWSDGQCYAVNEQGPCEQGKDVSVNLHTRTPECEDRLTSLNLVGAPCSGTNHAGQCTRPYTPPQNTFYSQVASQITKKPK